MLPHEQVAIITDNLFIAEDRRLNNIIEKLNQQNKRDTGNPIDGFLFKGIYYIPRSGSMTVAGPGQYKSILHPSLNDRMQTYLNDQLTTKNDKQAIRQLFIKMLLPCKTFQESRDALPEAVIDCLKELATFNRTNEAGYTLTRERDINQYQKLLPKIEMYSAARMIY